MEYLILFLKTAFVLQLVILLASTCTWFERKVSALIQDRVGANRAGTFFTTKYILLKPVFFILKILGILGIINTLFCDPVKAIFKEDFVPEGVSNFMHSLAPFLAVLPVFMAFAVIPLAPDFEIGGYLITGQLAQLNVGVLFLFAMGSLAVYGVVIAGLTGNNKFSFLGGLRASAQMISYELAMGVCFVIIAVTYQSLDFHTIISAQAGGHWGIFSNPFAWITMIILFIVGMAETKRGPFDMPEAESELVAGYFTEYSGMKFLLFWMGEFAEIALFSLVLSVFFFGAWDPLLFDLPTGTAVFLNLGLFDLTYGMLGALLGHIILMSKVMFFCILQVTIRWSLPRFRFDQLMDLGWKYLLPMSLVNLVLTAAWVLAFNSN